MLIYLFLMNKQNFIPFSLGMKWDFNMVLTCFMRFTKTELTNAVNGIMKGDCLGWTGAEAGVETETECVCMREDGQHVLFGLGTCSVAREFDIP